MPRKTVQNGVCLGKIKPSLSRLNFAKLFVMPPKIFHVCAIEQNRMPRKFAKQKGLFTGCFNCYTVHIFFLYLCVLTSHISFVIQKVIGFFIKPFR